METCHPLGLDAVHMGVPPSPSDDLIFDMQNGIGASGLGHPDCKGDTPTKDVINKLEQMDPLGSYH